jgi:heat shock protein HtpX
MSNVFKTAMLLAVLTAMLVLIGGAIGGRHGMLIALVFGDRDELRQLLVVGQDRAGHVRRAGGHRGPGARASSMVRRLATKAGVPMPRLYIIPSEQPNAFATGRNPAHAAVAVTEGIMRILDNEDWKACSPQLSHVLNRDVLISDDRRHAGGRHHVPCPHGPVGGLHGRRRS